MSVSKFQQGSGAYTCLCCGKLTRETGLGESGSEVCAYCFEVGGLENSYSDGTITFDKYNVRLAELQKQYGRED